MSTFTLGKPALDLEVSPFQAIDDVVAATQGYDFARRKVAELEQELKTAKKNFETKQDALANAKNELTASVERVRRAARGL